MSRKVEKTTNYDQFKFINANREQVRGHVENLKTAFQEVGNLTKVQPILVNERMEIIDGQHRFIASKELGEPIYYMQVPGLTVRDARKMNSTHRGWHINDYARSFALSGDSNYQNFLVLKEEYGFSHSILLSYSLNDSNKTGFKEFREGEFVLDNMDESRERLDKLLALGEYTPLVTDRTFALAVLKAFSVEGYDHARMLRKLAAQAGNLKSYRTLEDNLRQLEDVYNYQITEANRLRLY